MGRHAFNSAGTNALKGGANRVNVIMDMNNFISLLFFVFQVSAYVSSYMS